MVKTRSQSKAGKQPAEPRSGSGTRQSRRSSAPAAQSTKRKATATSGAPAKQRRQQAQVAPADAAGSHREGAAARAAADTVTINRAPVLTLWVAVVAQRQGGYSWQEALTFGRLVAGMMAQSKGRSLGIYEEREKSEEEVRERRRREQELGVQRVEVFGIKCPVAQVGGERRAVSGGDPIEPHSVQASLDRAFGSRLQDVKAALEELAAAIPPDCIGKVAYKLYEKFRPEWRGWGAKGHLSLQGVRQLARTWQQEA